MSDRSSTAPLDERHFRDPGSRPVAWREKGWPLYKLRLGQMVLGRDCEESQLPSPTAFERPQIVVGEAGAGMTSFYAWLGARHLTEAILLDLESPPLSGSTWRSKYEDLIQRFHTELKRQQTEFAAAARFVDLIKCKPVTILGAADRLDKDVAEVVFGELRGAVEAGRLSAGGLIIGVRQEDSIYSGVFSDFATVCDVSRLGYFAKEDVEQLLDGTTGLPQNLAAQCMTWTGGQPLLVQMFLAMQARAPDIDPQAIGHMLRDAPPRATWHWQVRLAELVRNPRIHQIVTALVGGQVLDDGGVPLLMHQLFVAGWTRLDKRRWYIRSECHKAWARPVLQDPAAYRKE